MEKLKSLIPEKLKQLIAESNPDDLSSTCSSLLDFFQQLPLFHQIVGEFTDPETALCRKSKEAALELKRSGNECYSKRSYLDALRLYSQALRVAPTDADDKDKNLVATLYVNRAAVLNKMNFLPECLRDCNRALQICSGYAKGWYRRGQTNASIGNYEEAVWDLNVAINMELSLSGRRQIESERNQILEQKRQAIHLPETTDENNVHVLDESHQRNVSCVFMPTKGRGMASLTDIPQSSLIHTEQPFAAIILKQCRETHCHFCFNELPVDVVPCPSCSIPVYCSEKCQICAGTKELGKNMGSGRIHVNLDNDLRKYIEKITTFNISSSECISEHGHECHGVHWPVVLPSEIVLIGRVLVKSMGPVNFSSVSLLKDLCHHYTQLSSEAKMELHIYCIILLYCLQQPCGARLPLKGSTISQCVILGSQIRVNSMTVVRMKSSDVCEEQSGSGKLSPGLPMISSLEQIRVGQALYLAGSLFNHSCLPNAHAYFVSRTLHIRSTETILRGSLLELSYGPQVGQWNCKDRQEFLENQYSFKCQCDGCSELNLSDLVINSYRCVDPNCLGVVLDQCMVDYLKNRDLEVFKFRKNVIQVAPCLPERVRLSNLGPGHCLSCGSCHDLEISVGSINKVWSCIKRLEDAIASGEVSAGKIVNSLKSLGLIRSTLYSYNRKIAEVEDKFAQAYCMVGELQPALNHCKASIQVLENLYASNHIVIGNELVKLASIQLLLRETAAVETINRLEAIFWRYYGPQVDIIFPHLKFLKMEALSLS